MPLPNLTHASYDAATGSSTNADWWGQNAPPAQVATPATPDPSTGPPAGQPSQSSAGVPSYVNPNDPVHQAVLAAFQKKGIQPRDQADFQYWVDHINESGGLEGGYAKAGGTGTWASRMAAGSGGVGDYGGGGGGGGGGGFGGGGYGSFSSGPGTFQAPSGLDMSNDPGYLARMQMGTAAIQGAAAAKGSLLSGGTLKALERYGQDYGSNEYGNVYGRAAQGYQMNVGTQRNAQQDFWGRLQNLYAGGQAANQQTYQRP